MLLPLVLAPTGGPDPAESPALVPSEFESVLGALLALPGPVDATVGHAWPPATVEAEEPAPPVTPPGADATPAAVDTVPRHTGAAVLAPAPDTTVADTTVADAALTDAALTDAALTDGVLTDAALTDAALTDAALTDAALTDGVLTDGVLTDGALTDGVLTDGVLTDGVLTDAALTDGVQVPGGVSGSEAAVHDDTAATGEASAPPTHSTLEPRQELTGTPARPVPADERQVGSPVAGQRGADRPPATGGPPTATPGPAQGRAATPEPAGAPAEPAASAAPANSDAGTPAQPATGPAGAPGAAAPANGLARRVAELVEALEHAPPPRRITVEVGETRLTVSLRGDAVQVSTSGPALPGGWRDELAGSLAQRGFTLAGEHDRERRDRGDGRGWRDSPDDTDSPPPRATARAAAGLRL